MALLRKHTEPELEELRRKMKLEQMRIDRERDEFIVLVVNSPPETLAKILFDMHRRIKDLEKFIMTQKNSPHDMIY